MIYHHRGHRVHRENPDPSLALRMTNWKCRVILSGTEWSEESVFCLAPPSPKGAGGLLPLGNQLLSALPGINLRE